MISQVPERPDNLVRGKMRLKKGWNQDKEANRANENTRSRVKKEADSRSKMGQVIALQAQAQQRQAFNLSMAQTRGMDLVAAATAAKAIANAKEGRNASEAGKHASASTKGKWAKLLAGASNAKQLARRIEKLNNGLFDVWQLKGFQEGVTGPHSGPGSKHHPGLAFDANTTRGNNTDFERRKLERLYRALQKAGIPLGSYNDPYEANQGSAGGHGHFELQQRRW